jgi:hypothetical protein
MRDFRSAMIGIAVAAVWFTAAGCKYDPQFSDGALRCSVKGECPQGYSCMANLCRSNKDSSRDAGLGGDAISAMVLTRYTGDWILAATSSVHTQCDDGFDDNALLNALGDQDPVTIDRGNPGVADLDSKWLCELYLRVDTAGAAHLFTGSPPCFDNSGDPTQSWTATQFDFSTSNGITATHSAFYNRVDDYKNGSVVNCTQVVRATLTKQ